MSQRTVNMIIMLLALALSAVYQFAPLLKDSREGEFDIASFGRLPCVHNGRIQPLDSIARNTLLMLSNRQSVQHGQNRMEAVRWLLEVIAKPEPAAQMRVFRIDHPDIRVVLGLEDSKEKRFTFNEIVEQRQELQRQVQLAMQAAEQQRTLFQRKILQLNQQLSIYQSVGGMLSLDIIPPSKPSVDWLPLQAGQSATWTPSQREVAQQYALALQTYSTDDAAGFNKATAALHDQIRASAPAPMRSSEHEAFFNHMEVFSRAMVQYLVVALLVFASWLGWRSSLSRAAMTVLIIAFLMHTLGIATRVYLSGRPPVTNLYSSALFVGWGSVLLCLGLERLFRNGIGLLAGAVTGFLTLMIAQGLSADGDTMAVLQAVLDTNFWLATHVIVITLGYASTYLAGFLGIVYVMRGVLTRSLTPADSKRMAQMIYGIVCFATLFSFVGTILGGIWADQSWGRFWGWDPKENGAMIIVLWNALILHARWGGMARHRGVAVLAIFGNIVTSWSWFGVNMLGRGLHSYGFMESAAFWLLAFVGSQLALCALGSLPQRLWRSGGQANEVRTSSLN